MSFNEKLFGLKREKDVMDKKARQESMSEAKREQKEKEQRANHISREANALRNRAIKLFKPILKDVNRGWVSNKGKISISPIDSASELKYLEAVCELRWDETEDSYHSIRLDLSYEENVRVNWGDKHSLKDEDWKQNVENDIADKLMNNQTLRFLGGQEIEVGSWQDTPH